MDMNIANIPGIRQTSATTPEFNTPVAVAISEQAFIADLLPKYHLFPQEQFCLAAATVALQNPEGQVRQWGDLLASGHAADLPKDIANSYAQPVEKVDISKGSDLWRVTNSFPNGTQVILPGRILVDKSPEGILNLERVDLNLAPSTIPRQLIVSRVVDTPTMPGAPGIPANPEQQEKKEPNWKSIIAGVGFFSVLAMASFAFANSQASTPETEKLDTAGGGEVPEFSGGVDPNGGPKNQEDIGFIGTNTPEYVEATPTPLPIIDAVTVTPEGLVVVEPSATEEVIAQQTSSEIIAQFAGIYGEDVLNELLVPLPKTGAFRYPVVAVTHNGRTLTLQGGYRGLVDNRILDTQTGIEVRKDIAHMQLAFELLGAEDFDIEVIGTGSNYLSVQRVFSTIYDQENHLTTVDVANLSIVKCPPGIVIVVEKYDYENKEARVKYILPGEFIKFGVPTGINGIYALAIAEDATADEIRERVNSQMGAASLTEEQVQRILDSLKQ